LQADAADLSVLVTGGAGFIGSHLCERLLTSGAEVTCLDNLSSGRLRYLSAIRREKRFRLIEGDILDPKTVNRALKGVDAVCHLAARVGVKHYVEHPIEVIRTNVFGTHNLLEACRRKKLKRFVFASTSEVYGKNSEMPLNEESDRVLGPPDIDRWCYSTSKSIDEHLCHSYAREYHIPLVVLRYFNTYGPRQESSDYGGVVSIFTRRVLDDQPPQVHGDGKQTRSFMFIDDAIDGTLISIVRSEAEGEAFNIGNPVETTILELAKIIIRVAGKEGELKPEFIPHNEFYGGSYEDLTRRVPGISKAKRVLGFQPRVPLMEGLQMTLEWYRKESTS
jgi:UDP-glucose 4-epimerase